MRSQQQAQPCVCEEFPYNNQGARPSSAPWRTRADSAGDRDCGRRLARRPRPAPRCDPFACLPRAAPDCKDHPRSRLASSGSKPTRPLSEGRHPFLPSPGSDLDCGVSRVSPRDPDQQEMLVALAIIRAEFHAPHMTLAPRRHDLNRVDPVGAGTSRRPGRIDGLFDRERLSTIRRTPTPSSTDGSKQAPYGTECHSVGPVSYQTPEANSPQIPGDLHHEVSRRNHRFKADVFVKVAFEPYELVSRLQFLGQLIKAWDRICRVTKVLVPHRATPPLCMLQQVASIHLCRRLISASWIHRTADDGGANSGSRQRNRSRSLTRRVAPKHLEAQLSEIRANKAIDAALAAAEHNQPSRP